MIPAPPAPLAARLRFACINKCPTCAKQRSEAADALDARDATIARLTRELDQWSKWGVIEVAIRNPSVAEFMRHWEGRAETAERERDECRNGAEMLARRQDQHEAIQRALILERERDEARDALLLLQAGDKS